MVRISIDIGGTFTDVVADTGARLSSVKVLTTPKAPEAGALDGVDRVLAQLSLTLADVTGIVHGTTLATNALIERRGARTAFVTTAGFRDVLEMRTEKRFDQYALDIALPEPLVPRPLRLGLRERILADGSVLRAPDDVEIDALADTLRAEGVEAVAIGFLHSYRNDAHEARVAERLAGLLDPSITICRSAEVSGEIREYDRFSTVCANASVRPLMARYLDRMVTALRGRGFGGTVLMMLSDGALTTLEQATRFPVRLVEGGPAGGVALAAHVAREIGSARTLSLDIGGTTAKICFIEEGRPRTTRDFEVARAWRDTKGSGLPVRVPTVELVEIGAGGGSISGVDGLGRLSVGPRSAGSEPGPAAYGRGGKEATVTDAHLVTGTIAAEGFAGGVIELAPERAPAAIARHVQEPLGLDTVEAAAAGIVEMAGETMANAARIHGVELGFDVANFDLLVSGGGGALHAARIAEKLGIRRIIVPKDAGVGSAVGFLRSPVAFERALTVIAPLDGLDAPGLAGRIAEALAEVRDIVAGAVPSGRVEASVTAELRYRGQGVEIALPLDAEDTEAGLADLGATFEARYRAMQGFVLPHVAIELVSLSVTARERREADPAVPMPFPDTAPPVETRQVFDAQAGRILPHRAVAREAMDAATLQGPALVTEAQTTTLVRPGWTLRRMETGHLLLERAP